ATNDVHYVTRGDAPLHDILAAEAANQPLPNPLGRKNGELLLKSAGEMRRLFSRHLEAYRNAEKIAARCDLDLGLGQLLFPAYPLPPGETAFSLLCKHCFAGAQERYDPLTPEVLDRLNRELKVIEELGFAEYFLAVHDIVEFARGRGIYYSGRGSAGNSIVSYVLRATDADPIEHDLLFERFLNPERISLPDIDMDFCGRRRGEMIEYVTRKYGQENVCQIITFGTMAARGAIRDVGRVLEVPLPEVDRVAKMIPFGPDSTIAEALKNVPELRELRDRNSKIAQLLSIAQRIEGQVRHPSIHAAGIVITPKPLVEFMPLYQSAKGEITTQFAMGDVEALGLLKMDLLGLRNLTVIDDALRIIRKDKGEEIDISGLRLDDALTFELFQAGNTDGVFQFESPGMKDLLRRFRPEQFRDLIALNALYRPGPLKSGMTDEFIHRKNHPDRVTYELPELEPILKETRGIIVYQEQVMRIATDLAGFTLAGADLLRKAMGKKDKETMKAQKQKFLQGAKKKGISQAKADKLFEQIKEFAEYGFNKSHSAAYALLAYQTGYLKSHYPEHYLAALLTSEAERGATPQVVKYIGECHDMGIEILPPDINQSDFPFTVEGGAVRFGLAAVKNVGQAAVEEILAIRRRNGPFASPFDLFLDHDTKVLNRKAVESLIKAGAFDSLGWKRSQCYHMLDRMIEFGHDVQKARVARQNLLFGGSVVETPPVPQEVQEMREWDESHVLSYEMDALGFYITGHPLDRYKDRLRKLVSHNIGEFDDDRDFDKEVRVAGIVTTV
ncbi:MAG TPA: DNA polymerase III subunit alpha, partial [Burkholderiales bacterium]|nr:DNA polymerase III subunit alpha [Burkholderiales bacterium]